MLHHVPLVIAPGPELSTGGASLPPRTVDERWRFGAVVPKRHAKRAVTRNLVKREARAVFCRNLAQIKAGDWLLRLRSPFAKNLFPSAGSVLLLRAVRGELEALFAVSAVQR